MVVASAMRHNLDAWAYLDDVLRRLAGGEVAVESLLLDEWAKTHPAPIRTYREAESLARAAQAKARRARRKANQSLVLPNAYSYVMLDE